jgi:hypothetical protein
MNRPRLSTFPLHKPFERQAPTTPLSQVALRLVANFYSAEPYVVGTATVLCGNLLVTAKHVFSDILEAKYLLSQEPNALSVSVQKHIVAIQIIPTPEPEYIIWDISRRSWTLRQTSLFFVSRLIQEEATQKNLRNGSSRS